MVLSEAENREALQEAIERLYETFAHYPLRDEIAACPCCVKPEHQTRLHAEPLRQLTGKDLSYYSGKAMTTWGDLDDFRHFLPRLLEILTIPHQVQIDPEMVTTRLDYGQWRTWPRREQRIIENFLMQMWFGMLDRLPWDPGANQTLSAIALAIDDLSPYLRYWQEACASSAWARGHLAVFLRADLESLLRNGDFGPWWEDRPAQVQLVAEWLVSPAVVEYVPQAFADFNRAIGVDERDVEPELSKTLELLRQLKSKQQN